MPLASLRTLVGKAVHVGGLIYMWRPFIQMFWAPLLNGDDSDNSFWCKRLKVAAQRLVAFIDGHHGSVQRTLDAATYMGAGEHVRIIVDASPWGIGGTLEINETIIAYFSDAVSDYDCEIHGIVRGDHRSQQCLEALAILVEL